MGVMNGTDDKLSSNCLIFGKPGEGLHKHFAGIAIFDVLATIGVAKVLSSDDREFGVILTLLIILSIIAHYLMGVPTTITKALFPNKKFDPACL